MIQLPRPLSPGLDARGPRSKHAKPPESEGPYTFSEDAASDPRVMSHACHNSNSTTREGLYT
jgi:hypothetical protein